MIVQAAEAGLIGIDKATEVLRPLSGQKATVTRIYVSWRKKLRWFGNSLLTQMIGPVIYLA